MSIDITMTPMVELLVIFGGGFVCGYILRYVQEYLKNRPWKKSIRKI